MKLDLAALIMYAMGLGLIIWMASHPDGVVKLWQGGLTGLSSLTTTIAHA